MVMGPKWNEYRNAAAARREAEGWLVHIGKTGRASIHGNTDRLRLSRAHASVKLVIAGQYDEGGTNYRDSTKAFNDVLLDVIHDRFGDLRKEVERRLREREAQALIAARDEVEATLSEIDRAAVELEEANTSAAA